MPPIDEHRDDQRVERRCLTGVGPVQWSELLQTIEGWSALWQAADGLHVGTVPNEQPWATHLWAWSDGLAVRVRIDRAVHATFLSASPDALTGVAPDHSVENATVLTLSSRTPPDADAFLIWQPTDRRVPTPDPAITADSPPWTLCQVISGPPITFVTRSSPITPAPGNTQ